MGTVFREPGTDLLRAVKEYFVSCKIWEIVNSQVFDGFSTHFFSRMKLLKLRESIMHLDDLWPYDEHCLQQYIDIMPRKQWCNDDLELKR